MVLLVFVVIVKADDIGVIQLLQNIDFLEQHISVRLVHLALREYFNGEKLTGYTVLRLFDRRKRTLANCALELKLLFNISVI